MIKFYNYIALIFILMIVSCASPKRTIYFNTDDKEDTRKEMVEAQLRPEVIIATDDILAINVSSIDAFTQKDPVSLFNDGGILYMLTAQGAGGGGASASQQAIKGYLVDAEGSINFPVLGKIHVSGLTPAQAREQLALNLKSYIKDPIVEVRVVNYKVNMIGEVGRVGPIIATNHKINIIEALSAAGDIPLTGRKDNVLIIREKNGKREFGHINLNSKSVFTSQYYYLQQNDIVYVEPNRIKRQETNEFLRFYLPTIASLLTTVFSVYGIMQLSKN